MFVTVEYLETRQLFLQTRTPDKLRETDYGGYRKGTTDSVYLTSAIFDYLGLAVNDQDYCPSDPADVEGLIALVENENRSVYDVHSTSSIELFKLLEYFDRFALLP